MNGSESPLYYSTSNVVSQLYMKQHFNSHLCPESLPQAAGVGEAELPLEPDEQPAEAEIQVARFLERENHTGHGVLCQRIRIRSHKNLCIKVAVEDRVDILQDVTQLLQLPLHASLQRKHL